MGAIRWPTTMGNGVAYDGRDMGCGTLTVLQQAVGVDKFTHVGRHGGAGAEEQEPALGDAICTEPAGRAA